RPHQLIAADTNLSLARIAAKRLSAITKSARQVDLTSNSSIAHLLTHTSVPDLRSPHSPSSNPKSITHNPQSPATRYRTLVTLFGVLPNLPPQPLLRRVSRLLEAGDLLLFSGNLAPGINGRKGALRVLSQYDNPPTRRWLLSALALYQPKLPAGKLSFGVFPDPSQSSLFRIEARWITPRRSWILFSSRRPTSRQVESWIHSAKLQRLHRWLDPRGEEGVWLVRR
ncbi:MAG: hypothetical protein NTZ01_04465, partial [Verrucomicrobia bacterium]|nr:hypothetical protein [Verrucomicrobiota bacterium]